MNAENLRNAILTDQLFAVRATVAISIPVNILLGAASLLVAFHADRSVAGLLWFASSSVINILRLALCRVPVNMLEPRTTATPWERWHPSVAVHLRSHTFLALMSGLVWAFIPALCDWYTSSQTLFYLTVVCGITAGAVTHGFAYARIPVCFITPPLTSVFLCLLLAGGFERYALAATVLLYLAALIRGTRVGQALIVNDSKLKNEATALYRSLEIANHQKTLNKQEMQTRAITDQLTGLLNRHGFAQVVEQFAILREGGSLILIDLDGFKAVNDAYGHKFGDEVLAETARRLTDLLPGNTALARLDADKFAILFGKQLNGDDAKALAKRIITAVAVPFSRLDAGRVGASVGIYLGPITEIDEMMIYGGAALYAAKKAGRNQYRLFDDKLRMEAKVNRDIERDLSDALAKEALEVWYQPIMADNGTKVDTFEALLRWKHPQHGWLSPPNIISVAAATGLSEPLLRFILRDVAITALILRSINRGDIRVALNVSPRELAQIAVDDLILSKLEKMGVSPTSLELEITEDVAIDTGLVQNKLAKLADTGIRLVIDDFGMGYSSLGSLQQIRADRVKIDKAFVTGTTLGSANCSLIDALLRVSKAYGFDVVAEGVETEEDFLTMQKLGCPLMQGYFFARPMPRERAISWLSLQMIQKEKST
jgi:diguanylate cyclase (GGDEF)-like protein